MSIGHKMTATADETLHFRHHLCSITLNTRALHVFAVEPQIMESPALHMFIKIRSSTHWFLFVFCKSNCCIQIPRIFVAISKPPFRNELEIIIKRQISFLLSSASPNRLQTKPITVKHYFTLRDLKPIVKLPFLFLPHYHFRYPTGLHRHLTLTFPRKEETPY